MKELARFLTHPEPCPYLPDRSARLEYRVVPRLGAMEYASALAEGWRRFGCALFRPRCPRCEECVPIRIAVNDFRASTSQQRVERRNRDLGLEIVTPDCSPERLGLHHRYHSERSLTRGWPPIATRREEYVETFVLNAAPTRELQYRLDDRLVGVAYLGVAADALNSIYAFFDPDQGKRSLGTLNVLAQIKLAREEKKSFLYLGFRVADCPSLNYKERFRPHQLLRDGEWI